MLLILSIVTVDTINMYTLSNNRIFTLKIDSSIYSLSNLYTKKCKAIENSRIFSHIVSVQIYKTIRYVQVRVRTLQLSVVSYKSFV